MNRVLADFLCALHALVVLIILFGWLVPSMWPVYMGLLVATLLSDLVFGYCILSKWEFQLRQQHNPQTSYNYYWTTHYTHRLTQGRISDQFFYKASLFFLISSLAINLYFVAVV